MIAVDTSSLVAYFADEKAQDVELINDTFTRKLFILPPVVLAEMLSLKSFPQEQRQVLLESPLLKLNNGFWQRVGETRAKLLSLGKKARIADTMIAVFCVDNKTPLITRDKDFRHFAELIGLELLA